MSVTSGFYNSLNGDRRYNAEQMSALFDSLINDGVFGNIGNAFEVKSIGRMKISVDIGRAWFNSTWLYNDSVLPLALSDSEVLLDRFDAVVIEINHTESVRAGSIKIVKGTASSSPQYPAMTSDTEVYQYPLAYIYVKAGATEITQAEITNVIGTSACPYITGILQIQDIDKNVAQWMAEWEQLTAAKEEEFDAWFDTIKSALDADVAAQLLNRIMKIEDGTTPVGDANLLAGLTPSQVSQSGARNLIPYPYHETSKTTNGITWTDVGNGIVTANGENTAGGQNIFNCRMRSGTGDSKPLTLEAGVYSISGCQNGGSSSTWRIQVAKTNSAGEYETIATDYGKGSTFTLTEETQVQIQLVVYTADAVDLIFKPMLEVGVVAHDFVSYYFGSNADTLDGQHLSDIQDWARENCSYDHPSSGVTAGTYRSVTVNAQGHVTGGSNPTVTIAQGGTGATTAAAARNALGLGNTTGALPIANGGTGATSASAALTALGAAASSHTHKYAASSSAGGAATSAISASTTTPTTASLKNIYAGTSALTAGSSSLTTGTIYVQYE